MGPHLWLRRFPLERGPNSRPLDQLAPELLGFLLFANSDVVENLFPACSTKLLLKGQWNQGLHCLTLQFHFSDNLLHGKLNCVILV